MRTKSVAAGLLRRLEAGAIQDLDALAALQTDGLRLGDGMGIARELLHKGLSRRPSRSCSFSEEALPLSGAAMTGEEITRRIERLVQTTVGQFELVRSG